MENPFEKADILESRWLQLGNEIKEKEAELQRLKERFRKIDEARLVIIDEMASGDVAARVASAQSEDVPQTLRVSVLQYINDQRNRDGCSASEVANALGEQGHGAHVTSKVFYSMVYLTLMRLVDSHEIKFKMGTRGRVFYANASEKIVEGVMP